MKVLFDSKRNEAPDLSIILLDWSCRESFHILRYLENQTALRERYEIIWVEYYNRRSPEIDRLIKLAQLSGRCAPVDKWVAMEMPEDLCYHKHSMFNVGICASSGRILVFADSDAIVKPKFVESIVKSFEENENIVLHFDEVRNVNKEYYPFNYPSMEEITGDGCINWENDQTIGLKDKVDPLHSRNYGACMAALKKDIINIGGADEHTDYLGHICGPYEMTFRLTNCGKKEIWHQSEFLYHLWHPGTDGNGNYLGPHDGRNFSSTALELRLNSRRMPLVENPAINKLRISQDSINKLDLLDMAVKKPEIEQWRRITKSLRKYRYVFKPKFSTQHFWIKSRLYGIILNLTLRQVYSKKKSGHGSKAVAKNFFNKIRSAFIFVWRMWGNNVYTVNMCHEAIRTLALEGVKCVSIYGVNDIAKILYLFIKKSRIEINAVYDETMVDIEFLGFKVKPLTSIKADDSRIIVTFFTDITEHCNRLKRCGVEEDNIVRLQ